LINIAVNDPKTIISNQNGLHENLENTVQRHLQHPFRRPIPDYSLKVFEQASKRVDKHNGAIIFDSYCGVGESTVAIAKANPDALVLGLDKSSHRLEKHDNHYRQTGIDNYLLLRADVDDFWRLAAQENWRLQKHFLLYPNPWPKAAHLQRRCHGSPLFPTLLALKGKLELRSNWKTYIEEFAFALQLAGQSSSIDGYQPDPAITPFERKYYGVNQDLWRCRCMLT
jgi:tRNA G46 methylase TrmB